MNESQPELEILEVTEPICLTFKRFDFVVESLERPGCYWVFVPSEDREGVFPEGRGDSLEGRYVNTLSLLEPSSEETRSEPAADICWVNSRLRAGCHDSPLKEAGRGCMVN